MQENEFTCVATITNIQADYGWYDIRCQKCNKKITSENDFQCTPCNSKSELTIPRWNIKKPHFYIYTISSKYNIKNKNYNYICKYKIQLNVEDETENTIFTLFDKEGERLIQTTAKELSNKSASVSPLTYKIYSGVSIPTIH